MFKPTFGQPAASASFGSSTSTPFGQTGSTMFGSTSAFGASATPLFGTQQQQSGGLFGSSAATPAFGQTATTQSGFGFGQTSGATPQFGQTQPNAGGSLFGTSAFGQQNKPFSGFGSTGGTNLFGQTKQTQPQASVTPLFGQTASTSGGLFGSTPAFGAGVSTGTTGTVIKFNPVTGTDTITKNGIIQSMSTRHNCITCQKEYESKSLEELRLEDYMANRKGPGQGTTATGGNLFGGMTQPVATGLFGSTPNASTSFGQSAPAFGASTSQPGGLFSKPFGATTTSASPFSFTPSGTTAPFGTNAPTPFGQPAAGTSGGLFNTPTSQSTGFASTNTGFGGFGTQTSGAAGFGFAQNKPAFSLPTSSAGGFGGFSQTQNQASNVFTGLKTTPAPAFGSSSFGSTTPAFGTTAATPFSSSFAQPQQPQLFSSFNKPAMPGFGLGQPSTGMGFGSNTNTGLFSVNKPGSVLGQPLNTGFSGFGTNNTFPSSSFGTGGLNTSFPTPVRPLGSELPKHSTMVHQQLMACSTQFPVRDIFKGLSPSSPSNSALPKITNPASINSVLDDQLKTSPPLSSKIKLRLGPAVKEKTLFDGLEEYDPSLAENIYANKRHPRRLILRKKCDSAENETELDDSKESNTSNQSKSNRNSSKDDTVDSPRAVDLGGSDWLKKSMQKMTENKETAASPKQLSFSEKAGVSSGVAESTSNLEQDVRDKSGPESSFIQNLDELENAHRGEGDQTEVPIKKYRHGIINTRFGYYTIPSMEDLEAMVAEDGTCIVDGFTVGRKGYGNVYFSDVFDVANLDIDSNVYFRHRELIIYPENVEKPPVGVGLNRRAQITLDKVWPADKNTRDPITDPKKLDEMDYETVLQKACHKFGTQFVEYRPETGSWVFVVKHFTRYGLTVTEEDELDADQVNGLLLNKEATAEKGPSIKVTMMNGTPPADTPYEYGAVNKNRLHSQEKQSFESPMNKWLTQLKSDILTGLGGLSSSAQSLEMIAEESSLPDSQEEEDSYYKSFSDEEGDRADHPSHVYSRKRMSKLELMQKTFFHEDDDSSVRSTRSGILGLSTLVDREPRNMSYQLNHEMALAQEDIETALRVTEPEPMQAAIIDRPEYAPVVDGYDEFGSHDMNAFIPASVFTEVLNLDGQTRCLADMSILKGRSHRASWGPRSTLVTLTSLKTIKTMPTRFGIAEMLKGRSRSDVSRNLVQCASVEATNAASLKQFQLSVEEHLMNQLEHSDVSAHGSDPFVTPLKGPKAMHEHSKIASRLEGLLPREYQRRYERETLVAFTAQVWKLCEALWGEMLELDGEPHDSHFSIMKRREALGSWLSDYVRHMESSELDDSVWSALLCHDCEGACRRSIKTNDVNLALLLCQMNGGPEVRKLIGEQIHQWQMCEVDKYIDEEKLKILMLVAGESVITTSSGIVNVCENLRWIFAFALHLWYIVPPMLSIPDAVSEYEKAYCSDEVAFAAHPSPPYFDFCDVDSDRVTYDVRYQLMKLYGNPYHSLDDLLNSASYTSDPLDYRLSWFLMQNLHALDYTHVREASRAAVNTNFAAQLERRGLWQWAVFALLHLADAQSRRRAVKDVIGRHVSLDVDDGQYAERERFLVTDLGIPVDWIAEAKAHRAIYSNDYDLAARYLTETKNYELLHDIVWRHVAPKEMSSGNFVYVKYLLRPVIEDSAITRFNKKCLVFWNFIEMVEKLSDMIGADDVGHSNLLVELSRLRPDMNALCAEIGSLSGPTAQHRLCKAEMSKVLVNLVKQVAALDGIADASALAAMARMITDMPLPPDYTYDELTDIVDAHLDQQNVDPL